MRNPQEFKILKEEECFEIVQKKLREDAMEQYRLVSYDVIPLSAVNGFMGQYFALRATVAAGPQDTKSITFFTKLPPPSSSPQHEFEREMGSFKKEVAIYTTVFPELFTDFERRCVPQCFLGLDNTVIVLEDMGHRGFEMPNKFIPFDYDHCAVMMHTIGKFHSKSMIFEKLGKRSLHDKFSHCMHETLWPLHGNRGPTMFHAAVKGLISMIDLINDLNDEQKKKFKEKVAYLSTNHASKLLPSEKFKNVLCHGDLWANNVLFKYDANRKPIDCCFIDFQLARYNPPAHDLMCFLQFSTMSKLRSERLNELLKIYHESVSTSLKESSLNPNTIFPWEELENSVAELRQMCMVHGALNTPIMLLDEAAVSKYFVDEPERLEEVLYVDRTPLICGQYSEVATYRERMRDLLLELYDCVCA